MWQWLIAGGVIVWLLVLLVAWSLMVMAARGDEDIKRLMAASGPGAPEIPGEGAP
jgi:hypothetical protein